MITSPCGSVIRIDSPVTPGRWQIRNYENIESYFYDPLSELEQLADRGDAWVFLYASALTGKAPGRDRIDPE